uniref:DUF2970 domain-containing protein n=1 Tax=Heterorhabditis bacteriophora TaxID=37862 RepID=A0A1I7XA76_HETBA
MNNLYIKFKYKTKSIRFFIGCLLKYLFIRVKLSVHTCAFSSSLFRMMVTSLFSSASLQNSGERIKFTISLFFNIIIAFTSLFTLFQIISLIN